MFFTFVRDVTIPLLQPLLFLALCQSLVLLPAAENVMWTGRDQDSSPVTAATDQTLPAKTQTGTMGGGLEGGDDGERKLGGGGEEGRTGSGGEEGGVAGLGREVGVDGEGGVVGGAERGVVGGAEGDIVEGGVGGLWCPLQCDCFNYYETVDCSRRGLTSLPMFSDVTRRLYLEGDQLDDLPSGIFQRAANLSVIILENNRLKIIDSSIFCGLDHLQEIDLSTNKIESFIIGAVTSSVVEGPNDIPCSARGLKEINLSHNALRSIPPNISSFAPNLEILNLAYNEITSASLDVSYVTLTSLRYLDLGHNDIRRVRVHDLDSVRAMPVLETLSLADCGLVVVEDGALRGLDNLTSLTLARSLVNHTVLENMFNSFSVSNQLTRLDISETYLMNLTVSMLGPLTHLVALFASYCDLEFIEPDLFDRLQELETLHVEGGQLTSLDHVTCLRKLSRLNVHMNRLTSIDLSGLDSLESVDLSYNQIQNLQPGWIGGEAPEDIQMLNLSHNRISSIAADAFSRSVSITTLDLSYNSLSEFPHLGSIKVSKVDLSHNGMHTISARAFETLHQTLTELDLSYNDLAQFPSQTFADFHSLQYLNLAHNRLGDSLRGAARMGNLFDSLQLLQVFDLSYNDITTIGPGQLSSLHHLNTLNLQGNLIRDIQDTLIDSTRVLSKLILSSNHIRSVNIDILAHLEYLEELDLSDNPFDCSCSLAPFLDWLNDTLVTVLHAGQPPPGQPRPYDERPWETSREPAGTPPSASADDNGSCHYCCNSPANFVGRSIFSQSLYSFAPECRVQMHWAEELKRPLKEGHVEGEREASDRGSIVEIVVVVSCFVVCATSVVLVCYFGQVTSRVKSLRYRWQVRYREVSGMETGLDQPKI